MARWEGASYDAKGHVLCRSTARVDSINTALIRVAEIFRQAIKANCASFIAAHNHPYGDAIPWPEDVAVAERVVAAAKLLHIEVLHHLVISHQRGLTRADIRDIMDAVGLRRHIRCT